MACREGNHNARLTPLTLKHKNTMITERYHGFLKYTKSCTHFPKIHVYWLVLLKWQKCQGLVAKAENTVAKSMADLARV